MQKSFSRNLSICTIIPTNNIWFGFCIKTKQQKKKIKTTTIPVVWPARERFCLPFIKIYSKTHKYSFELLKIKKTNTHSETHTKWHFWRFLDLRSCFLYLRPIICELSFCQFGCQKTVLNDFIYGDFFLTTLYIAV